MNALLIITLILVAANAFGRRSPSTPYPKAFNVGIAALVAGLVFRFLAGPILGMAPTSFRFFAGLPLLIAIPALLISLWLSRQAARRSG